MDNKKVFIGTHNNSEAVRVCLDNPELEAAYNHVIDWDAVVNLMDDDIREAVHADFAGETEEEFLVSYLEQDPAFWAVLRQG